MSIYASDKDAQQEAYYTICRSKNFIRNMLKDKVQIRLLPELTFLIDDSVDYSIKIDKILNEIHAEEEKNQAEKEQ